MPLIFVELPVRVNTRSQEIRGWPIRILDACGVVRPVARDMTRDCVSGMDGLVVLKREVV